LFKQPLAEVEEEKSFERQKSFNSPNEMEDANPDEQQVFALEQEKVRLVIKKDINLTEGNENDNEEEKQPD
jgi:hypothetical protein